jgi:hypothetical protein
MAQSSRFFLMSKFHSRNGKYFGERLLQVLDELSAFNPRMSVLMHLDVVWGLVSFETLSWA